MAYIPYIRNVLMSKTKLERMSWLIWLILGLVSLASQISLGATYSLSLAYILTLGSLVIFLLSIRYGVGGFNFRDIVALSFSIIGFAVWLVTNTPLVSLIINVTIGSVGALMTIMKTIEHPGSETKITWLLASIAGLTSLLSIGKFKFVLMIYPIYITATNFGVYLASRKHHTDGI